MLGLSWGSAFPGDEGQGLETKYLVQPEFQLCFVRDQESPFWVPERLTRTVKSDPQHADSPEDLAAVPPAILRMDNSGCDEAPMGDALSLPKANTSQP
ncbi:hypothetical protein U0070_017899 [Myodes glareolus]|uniref:Uncharacterized protein n=1 Tax=Myodes glareolus TaxID=447135 RepID=A0AAW0K8X6_MYOGA